MCAACNSILTCTSSGDIGIHISCDMFGSIIKKETRFHYPWAIEEMLMFTVNLTCLWSNFCGAKRYSNISRSCSGMLLKD